jgi:hypothetical protein
VQPIQINVIYFAFELVLLDADPGRDCLLMRDAPVIDPRLLDLLGKLGNFASTLESKLAFEERLPPLFILLTDSDLLIDLGCSGKEMASKFKFEITINICSGNIRGRASDFVDRKW